MDKAALDRIVELAAASQDLHGTDMPGVVLPGDTRIENLECLSEYPWRQRVRLETSRISDFITYVRENGDVENSAIFVCDDGSGARACIDFGTADRPLWKQHVVGLKLAKAPEFAALECAEEQALSQRDLTDWIEDWAHIITPQCNGEEITAARAVQSIRRVEVNTKSGETHEENDFNASRSSFASIEARSGAGSLPDVISVHCSIYRDTSEQTLQVRLSVLTGLDKPRFRLRIMRKDAVIGEVANEVESRLKEELYEHGRVFIATFNA